MTNKKIFLGIGCLLLTLLTLAITITINFRPLYAWDISNLNILDYVNVNSKKKLLANFDVLMKFLNSPFNKVLNMPEFPSSANGIKHFEDVKILFMLNYFVLLVTIIPSILFVRSLFKKKLLYILKRPLMIAAVAPLIFAFLMALNFNVFFNSFHQLFFSNDDWLFDPMVDPIILALPSEFFMHCFILFFILFICLILIILSLVIVKEKNTTV